MSILTLQPESFTHTYEWMTDVLVSINGNEQRISIRQEPRQNFAMSHLADSDEEIQQWRYELFTGIDGVWTIPIWPESETTTSESTTGGSTIDADFTMMDDALGAWAFLIADPELQTYEIVFFVSRTSTTLTILGTLSSTYPTGSSITPLEQCLVQNNSGYQAMSVNAASVEMDFQQYSSNVLSGKGATALTLHNTIPVLDRRPEEGSDSFFGLMTRLDYGHKTYVLSEQVFANITSSRSYTSRGKADRQWWKLFLSTVRGQLKPFYCSTYRPDMTIDSQPAQAATTIDVVDDATVAGINDATGWESSLAHAELAIDTADDDTQYVTMTAAVDNGNGTHTITITPALTNTEAGSTVLNISFLELSRLGSDSVQIEHLHDSRTVNLSTRTIQA